MSDTSASDQRKQEADADAAVNRVVSWAAEQPDRGDEQNHRQGDSHDAEQPTNSGVGVGTENRYGTQPPPFNERNNQRENQPREGFAVAPRPRLQLHGFTELTDTSADDPAEAGPGTLDGTERRGDLTGFRVQFRGFFATGALASAL